MKKNKYEIDMVNGSIMDKLVSFSLPLMATSILQLMFNAVDIIVVGHFSGSDALAAVGATTALINIFTNLFIGISMGANVLCVRFISCFCRFFCDNLHHGVGVSGGGTDLQTSFPQFCHGFHHMVFRVRKLVENLHEAGREFLMHFVHVFIREISAVDTLKFSANPFHGKHRLDVIPF